MLLMRSKLNYRLGKPLNTQQGVVIVVALFVVALVAAMAYVMMARLERDTRRTTMMLRDIQAQYYAQASVDWAVDQLRRHWEVRKSNQRVDQFPLSSPVNNENGYQIISTIEDMQARFNINTLVKPEQQKSFKHLLKALQPNLSEAQLNQITQAIVDWIAPSAQQTEWLRYYAGLSSPYRQPHRPMFSVSELRLVKGVSAGLYNALRPYVTALPSDVAINVQTAGAAVLLTLNQAMTWDTAKALEQTCRANPPLSVEAFQNLSIVKNHGVTADQVTVVSNYFLVRTEVTIENQHVVLYTLLERRLKGDKVSVIVIWQSEGSW